MLLTLTLAAARYWVTPAWLAYQHHERSLTPAQAGNTVNAAWRPRRGATLYSGALLALLCAAAHLASSTAARSNPLSQTCAWMLCLALLWAAASVGFIYTRWVTTAASFLSCRHGCRDLLLVYSVMPFMAWLAVGSLLEAAAPAASTMQCAAAEWWSPPPPPPAPPSLRLTLSLLVIGYWLGLHLLYVTPLLGLDTSVSALEVQRGGRGLVAKATLLALALWRHGAFLAARRRLLQRIGLYAALAAPAVSFARLQRRAFAPHLHHWLAGALLAPLARAQGAGASLLLLGICVGQTVEGAARWGCAPFWHAVAAPAAPPVASA